jgi:hypothetical protein
MKEPLALNGTYRLKADVFAMSVTIDGKPLHPDVTIVRTRTVPGRKLRWYYDARGNAYRASDFVGRAEVIDVEAL